MAVFPPSVDNPPTGKNALRITDMSGCDVELVGPASRIMVNTPITWHYLAITGSDEAVIMIPPYMKREVGVSVLGKIYPSLNLKPLSFLNNASAAPFSVEQAMLINPDVVLSWDYISASFENVKFPGLVKIAQDDGDKRKLFQVLGELSGRSERVAWLWSRHQKEMAYLRSTLRNDVKKKKMIILANTDFALWNNASQPHVHQWLRQLGGLNLAEKMRFGGGQFRTSAALNLEALLRLDPDLIYINPYALAFASIDVAEIYTNPKLQGLKAVKNKRIYHMPSGAARLEGPVEEPLFMIWMYQTMHPELPSAINLRDKIKEAFIDMYHYEMSDREIDDWLRLEENQISNGYDRFRLVSDDHPAPATE